MSGVEHLMILLVLILTRVSAFLSTFPLFRTGTVPMLVKVSLATSLSTLWLTGFVTDGHVRLPDFSNTHWIDGALAIGREAIVGAVLGYVLGLLFLPAQIAGSYLGQEIGFNMAGVADPTTEASTNTFGDLLGAFATLLFFLADGHQLAIGAIYTSFSALPLGAGLPAEPILAVTSGLASAHRWGLELAAPLGVCLFLITVVTAMLMKLSPQMNLFSIGIPVRLLLGLLSAMVFFPDMTELLLRIFSRQQALLRQLGF